MERLNWAISDHLHNSSHLLSMMTRNRSEDDLGKEEHKGGSSQYIGKGNLRIAFPLIVSICRMAIWLNVLISCIRSSDSDVGQHLISFDIFKLISGH